MKDIREEVGTKACIVGKIVKGRMKWAGHMVRMKDERLLNRSETKKQGGLPKTRKTAAKMRQCHKLEAATHGHLGTEPGNHRLVSTSK